MFKYQFERRNVDYIVISPVEIKQEEIERSELEIFYNENKDLYKTDETRDFSIISLNILDISRQENVSDNELNVFYEDNKYNYYEPEKRSYYLIPFSSEEKALEALESSNSNDDIEKILKDRNLEISDVDQGLITFDEGISESVSEAAFNLSLIHI